MIDWLWPLRRLTGGSLDRAEFGEILDALQIRDGQVFGLPWGAGRQDVQDGVPPEVADGYAPGESESLLRYDSVLGGHAVEVWFTVSDDEGLCHVAVEPRTEIRGAAEELEARFGDPDMDFGSHGERHRVWNRGDCVIELTEARLGFGSLTIQPPYLDDPPEVS